MPETIQDKKIFTLLEVTKSIEKTLRKRYTSSFWVKAEMNKLNYYSHSGHCYPDLVEKQGGKVIAQIRAVLWKNDYLRINNRFVEILKEPLKDGIKILFLARISFSPMYGLTLVISDIDASYTLGDLEKEKQATIQKLRAQGIFDRNRGLPFPLLPQRIAIISVETSKGYADFMRILDTNPNHYRFFSLLFPALLQGEKAAERISGQLDRIERVKRHFDVVAIIRGGGGEVGLSCYNHFDLVTKIANFPLPVITGIGHATNETVTEMVAHINAITPSKLAEYLLQKFHDFAGPVQEAERIVTDRSNRILKEEKMRLYSEVKLFRSVTENILSANRNNISGLATSLMQQSRFRFKNEIRLLKDCSRVIGKDSISFLNNRHLNIFQLHERLWARTKLNLNKSSLEVMNLEKNIDNMDPKNVLKRGYSITLHNGKAVKDLLRLKTEDSLQTITFEGEITSVIKEIKKRNP